MKRAFIFLIDLYKLALSPFFGQQCRFYPTCSSYAKEAIERHGALRGGWLAIKRILRCNPWCAGGVDEVPPATPHLLWLVDRHHRVYPGRREGRHL